jgi:hypothetical protein
MAVAGLGRPPAAADSLGMEQTMTTIRGGLHRHDLFVDDPDRVKAHVELMNSEGWVLVSTLTPGYGPDIVMMFWRRD